MGKIKYISKIREFAKETPVFRASDIERIAKDKEYAHLALHNLVKQGEIFRIKKGWYSVEDDPTLSVFCFRPAYLGLQNALSFHNIWEQETNPVIITSNKVRTGVREIFESNVVIHRIKPKYMFGFDFFEKDNYSIPVSDLEKTFIDLKYFNVKIDKNILEKIKRKADNKKIKSYLDKYPKRFKNNF